MNAVVQSPKVRELEFERSIRPHLASLRSAARRITGNVADADDLVQETLLRAFRFWDRYEADSHLRAWLFRILRNSFVNDYRKRTRERALLQQARAGIELIAQDQEREPLADEMPAQLNAALVALPEEFRAVLWTVAVDDASYLEAAQRLGCPVGTVMSRLHRARKGMRALLDAQSDTVVPCRDTARSAA